MENTQLAIKHFFEGPAVQNKFKELLGKKAQGFITSVLQVVANNKLLAKADPVSVYQSAAIAATLDLPINNNLGFAYLVPYNEKGEDGQTRCICQFQMGWRGYVQLGQRSGQYKTISATQVYEGQLTAQNPLLGYQFDFTKKTSETVIGYASYFQLINGFEKVHYMTMEELEKHAKKYSQTYRKGYGKWKDDFHNMSLKTVLKLLIAKFGPLSIDVQMQTAVIADQAVITDGEADYVDNVTVVVDKEAERIEKLILKASTPDELELLKEDAEQYGQMDLFNERLEKLAA